MSESVLQISEEPILAILESSTPVLWDWGVLQHSELIAYEKAVVRLGQQARLDDISLLLRITQEGAVRRTRVQEYRVRQRLGKQYQVAPYQEDARTFAYLDRAALAAARVLVQLAEDQPTRELLPALEALRSGLANANAPLEFIPIRRRLMRALKHLNNLPIPASAPELLVADLPIPVEALDD